MGPVEPRLHAVLPGAITRSELDAAFPGIVAAFSPHAVRYGNTNPQIDTARDGEHGESIEWKASCYMEKAAENGGARQVEVAPSAALLQACAPLLRSCDAAFTSFYERLHGAGSVRKLTRLQSFVTRYRPHAQEAGLLRHIDGASVDGSLILALSGADGGGGPTDIAFEGGGVTVWEGGDGAAGRVRDGAAADAEGGTAGGAACGCGEVAFEYAMRPGDLCLLDNYVWHQGNPIRAGERWALVVFYQTRASTQNRLARIVLHMARQVREREAAAAAAAATTTQRLEGADAADNGAAAGLRDGEARAAVVAAG